ncbi:MAG: DUF2249 domain-containing protein [Porticoccaceae bacterium]|jgi:hypothetical protein|nr:DUF2249 domain-containing protein [Porticoccaceae bacterium]
MPPDAASKSKAFLLDARGMDPPEPFVRAMNILAALNQGDYLHFLHIRSPVMLFPELETLGMSAQTFADSSGLIHVFVWRENDNIAEKTVHHDIASLAKPGNQP